MPWEFEREHCRIVYPTAARPRFTSDGIEHPGVDISEQGMRCRLAQGETRAIGYLRERYRGSAG